MRKPESDTGQAPELRRSGTAALAPTLVLDRIGQQRRIAQQAEAAELQAVVAWADLHTLESPVDRSFVGPRGAEGVLFLAGTGAHGIAEFAVCQVATTLAMSETKARRYLGEALELRDRLPRMYARALAGDLPVWRARQVAEQTLSLAPETAAFVDAQLAEFAHKISRGRVRRCVEAAIIRCQPEEAAARAADAAERRCVKVEDHLEGVSTLLAVLNTPDAAALEGSVADVAEWLAILGDSDSLDVRRSRALGLLADPQAVLDFRTRLTDHLHSRQVEARSSSGQPSGTRRMPRPHPVEGAGRFGTMRDLHIHLHTTAEGALGPVARVEGAGRRLPVPTAAVEQWLQEVAPGVQIKLTPVVDLNDHISVDGYEAPARLSAQLDERDLVCAFPWCGRRGRYDHEHIEEYVPPEEGGPPGQTNTLNLTKICRFHHRVKTHSAWDYWREPDGSLTWQSPLGQRYRVDHTGTTRL